MVSISILSDHTYVHSLNNNKYLHTYFPKQLNKLRVNSTCVNTISALFFGKIQLILLLLLGLICSEGELWKDQRKFIHACLRQFGAVKNSPKRAQLEEIITKEVIGFIEVNLTKEIIWYISFCSYQYIKAQGDGKTTTIEPLDGLRHHLGSVMNRLTFGKSWSMDDPIWKWLQDLQEEGTKLIGVSGPLNFLPFLRFV